MFLLLLVGGVVLVLVFAPALCVCEWVGVGGASGRRTKLEVREVKVKVQWNCRNGVEVCDNDTCIPLACAQIAVLIMLGLGRVYHFVAGLFAVLCFLCPHTWWEFYLITLFFLLFPVCFSLFYNFLLPFLCWFQRRQPTKTKLRQPTNVVVLY